MSEDLLGIPQLSLGSQPMNGDEMIRRTAEQEIRPLSPDCSSVRRMETGDSCCTDMEPTERGKMDVLVIPAKFHRTDSKPGPIISAYNMIKDPRGLAMIIDIETYENDIQERRVGSHVDVENLKSLFVGLSFAVSVHKNLALNQFYQVVKEFRDNKLHLEADMAVIVILSHGKDGIVYAADGQSIDMEYIYEFFNNRNCPSLQGKPKFFIVQACRGDRPDQGVETDGISNRAGGSKKRRAAGLDSDGSAKPDIRNISRARPTWEDMIIAYSTIPGYASLRDHELGTWFIQSLVEVFMNHAHDTELVDLLRMTSERLSQFTNEQGEKQTCNVEMRHLYKRIYFNPGLGRTPSHLSRSLSTPPASPYTYSVDA